MLELIIVFGIALYVAWSIGANDETMSLLAGSGFVNVLMAAALGGIMAFLGSIFFGYRVEATVGKGLVLMEITLMDVLVIMFSVATWMTAASYWEWPISTTHSTIGAAIGLGLIKGGLGVINWGSLTAVAIAWVLSPLIGLFGTVLTVKVIERVWHKYAFGLRSEIKIARGSAVLLLIASCFTAFSRSANDIAKATAFFSVIYGSPLLVRFVGGVGMMLGLLVLGRRVIKSVGLNLTKLNPMTALSAQVTTALTIFIGTFLGLPLSTTHILVGAVIGVGLTKGIWMNVKGLKEILYASIATFLGTIIISVIIYLVIFGFSGMYLQS